MGGSVIVCDIFPMSEDRGHSLRTINITWRELLGLLYKCLLRVSTPDLSRLEARVLLMTKSVIFAEGEKDKRAVRSVQR